MALQTIGNNLGIYISSLSFHNTGNINAATMNAAGESFTAIGRIHLEGGTGSKTISSAGGKIHWRSSTITFSNAGTNLRIGIQDIAATGLEDGTFDVYADLVGGTDTITGSTVQSTAMETGTKTIGHGDIIGIAFETTTRGGTDSVTVAYPVGTAAPANPLFPYITLDTGAGPTRNPGANMLLIEFDDGTFGWLEYYGGAVLPGSQTNQAFNSGSTPDEYAAVFQVPFKTSINKVALSIGSVASTDTFEVILYSDPEGTPVAERTTTVDPHYVGNTTQTDTFWVALSSGYTLSPNTWYAVALRPTSANSINFGYYNLGSGHTLWKKSTSFGTNIKMSSRTNQTGAFSEVQNYYLPILYLSLNQLDDGVSTGTPFIIGG